MEPAKQQAQIISLHKEMDAIYCANGLYWKQGNCQTKAARAEYQFRKERLDVIRKELEDLKR